MPPTSTNVRALAPDRDEARRLARIEEVSAWRRLPLLPELELRLAAPGHPLWDDPHQLDALGDMPTPWWAIAWAGGVGLSRYLLDHPEVVRGRRVLDFATGAGLAAIAAARSGAARVVATEIDPWAVTAARCNALRNGVSIELSLEDWIGRPLDAFDVVLAGDVCYEEPTARRVHAWLRAESERGRTVLLGDPGRTWMPKEALDPVAHYHCEPESRLDDDTARRAIVWRFRAGSAGAPMETP
jgi:predicted nicotinamide N-methyase